MGFIQSNHSRILFNSTMISFNVAEAARVAGVKRDLVRAARVPRDSARNSARKVRTSASSTRASPPSQYASSACEFKQLKEDLEGASGLKEDDAWPAQPQDAYGLEKLMTEELLMHYEEDFGMVCRIGRFHNIYGPCGTWKGGREKAPAAFCRKAITSTDSFEMWGNGARRPHAAQFSARNSPRAILRRALPPPAAGKQTRSFCYIDDDPPPKRAAAAHPARNSRRAIADRRRAPSPHLASLLSSDYKKPLNVGSDEMVSMNQMADLVQGFAGKAELPTKHIPGPEGVRGRNSDNTLIKQVLGWAPQTLLAGLGITYKWIDEQVAAYGADTKALTTSTVVGQG